MPNVCKGAVFPGEVHWGTRCPMFAGDAVRGGEDQVYIYSLLGIITVCINGIQ